ncbi:MAG: hypothetical protein CL678_09945 [Bdellovibrionaceae bacterium]|nr:hypothetical protein [Pseudobdellovibrionaceae bacterium]|tara:strand:- start:190 stop:1008 length:819 start_codon:yes stop_codon:yes gene_type:complete
MKHLPFFLFLLSFTTLSGWAQKPLAVVNGKSLSVEDFNEKYKQNKMFYQFRMPTKDEVLKDWVTRQVALSQAKKEKLDQNQAIQEQMDTVLYRAFIQKKLGSQFDKIFINTEDAKKWYEKNPEIRTRHIFIRAPLGSSQKQIAEAQKKIQEINKIRIKNKEKSTFAEIAQKYSEGMAAQMGGDIGYQTKDQLDPDYYRAAIALKTPGKVSSVIRSAHGFHIIQLTGVKKWEETDQPKVKKILFEREKKKLFDQYMKKLESQAKIKINRNLLK